MTRLLSHQIFGLLHSNFCYLFAPFLQLDFHRLQESSPGSLYSLSRRRIVCKCLRLPAFVFKLLLQLLAFFMEFLFAFIGIVTWTGLPTMAGLVTLFFSWTLWSSRSKNNSQGTTRDYHFAYWVLRARTGFNELVEPIAKVWGLSVLLTRSPEF